MQVQLNEEDLNIVYNWVDEIPLSRPKKNISRDFADGVLVAEIINNYNSSLIEVHNYVAAHSVQKKKYNWETMNKKVFKKLGFQMTVQQIDSIVNAQPDSIECFLRLLKSKLDGDQPKNNFAQEDQSPNQNNEQSVNNQDSPKDRNNAVDQQNLMRLQEYEQTINELRETIDLMDDKVKKLEQENKQKDNKILAMQKKMQVNGLI